MEIKRLTSPQDEDGVDFQRSLAPGKERTKRVCSQFYQVQLTLLGHDVLNVRLEFWVRFQDFGPDTPLHRGLDLGLCTR